MGKRVKFLVATVSAAVAATIAVTAATGARNAEPGLTSDKIVLGAAVPLTGPASSYGTIARAIEAYFKWYNDTRGGVYGRKIQFVYHDHAYVPAQAALVAKQLVEQDNVFACFNNLGTEHNEAMQDYLKAKGVPNLFVATGASEFGTNFKNYPMQIGYQPDYVSEGRIYGQFIRTKVPQAKIAVLAQDDSYGNDLLNGFLAGLGPAKSKIVETQKYQTTDADITSYVAKLKASGANVFMDFATLGRAQTAEVVAAKLGWNPTTFINNVASVISAQEAAGKAGATSIIQGSYTTQYGKDPADPQWANDPAIKQYRAIMAKYYPAGDPNSGNNLYGFGVARVMVQTLIQAGKNPTRASLVRAATHLNMKVPYLLPGVTVTTSPTDHFPLSQMRLAKYNNGHYIPFGPVIDGRPSGKSKTSK
jgi:branched-chain amino acid transport system substrate-binding protein